MNTELFEALTILEKEKEISKETLLDAIENSLINACKNHFGKADNIKVVMNRETCDYSLFAEKTVVEEVEDPVLEISLAEAKMKISYQWKDARYNPNPVVGEQMPNIAVGDKYLDFYFFNVHVHDSEMKKMDDFLSCYGYATNKVKIPNLTGRKYWNFVQTENATISGDMPASSKEALGRIFDGGITFWHSLDKVGNYLQSVTEGSIDNPIV